ncbi:hypothetical protein PPYR_10003 [Photinus pyralis]|uniref:Uncharacterized protein n=1 Tax=Photinus pyralis TaxID=7054 RepID=A0A5N4AF39_PHOPY|nr:hypothetical protein PPYR_10003 [Photinus pyralis]
MSDHMAQVNNFEIIHSTKRVNSSLKLSKPITNMSKFMFYRLLENCDWSFIDDGLKTAEEKFSTFITTFLNYIDCSFPAKVRKGGCTRSIARRWYNGRLKNMHDVLLVLNGCYKRVRNDDLRKLVSNYRKLYKVALQNAKIATNDAFIKASSCKSKAIWQVIKQNNNDNQMHTQNRTPNEFNNFFVQIAGEISASLPVQNNDPITYFSNFKINNSTSFDFQEISFNEMRDTVSSINNSGCRDHFGITADIVKSVLNVIIVPLTKIINACTYEIQFTPMN